jgi:hypothetical protein
MPQFLKGVDLIVGQDWMMTNGCLLDLGNGTCCVRTNPPGGQTIVLHQLPCSRTRPTKPLEASEEDSDTPVCGMISARLTAKYLKKGYATQLLIVKPSLVGGSEYTFTPGPPPKTPTGAFFPAGILYLPRGLDQRFSDELHRFRFKCVS